ncbi:hypothetical protein SAGO17_0088 [Mimivirus AB-566-O17]|uniref:Uncharacterized protein n=1 Tax=Mimivirus AB-566-O17 TaxID=1988039 RepID=A0A1X9VNW6_9VIRU|nr:hypothetical protein SAGO17_0088 [Mimivirus AB-566-O17]
MSVLSIDVGLLNLGVCIMNVLDNKILYWDTIDVIDCPEYKCDGVLKNGNGCKSIAHYSVNTEYYCKRHNVSGKLMTRKAVKNYTLEQVAVLVIKRMNVFLPEDSPEDK